MLTYKVTLGAIATILGLIGYVPYFRDIYLRKTKPHAFSWLIWGILTASGFAGQVADKGGPGSWITGVTAAVCLLIFALALQRGERDITRSDWACLLIALGAIPLWIFTATPLWSVILITLIDVVAFLPTIRKSYLKPEEETASTYLMSSLKFSLSIAALEHYSLITVLYPASLVVVNFPFVLMLYLRRRSLRA